MRTGISLVMVIAAITGCGSNTPGGSYLYDTTGPTPRLLDSEIQMSTRRPSRGGVFVEKRRITCHDGVIEGFVTARRGEGHAEIPFEAYARLWKTLREGGAMKLSVDSQDRKGGPYHTITLTLGREANTFSAQFATNILGTTDRDTMHRVDLANAIARLLADHVKLTPRVPADTDPSEKKTP